MEIVSFPQITPGAEVNEELLVGARPLVANANGTVLIRSSRGLMVNSLLRENEWKQIDQVVITAARYPLRLVSDLRSRGLTRPLGGVGTLVAQWYMRGEVTPANVSMTGQGSLRDLPDLKTAGVPVPVVSKEFAIDFRTLEASRRLGDGLDTSTAEEAARAVAEAYDDLVLNGKSNIVVNGATIYGYKTHPNRNTDTATNFGGGDWSADQSKVIPTIAGMITAANSDHHYGPFELYLAQDLYNEAALKYYSDGSGQTPLQRIMQMPAIAGVTMIPQLSAGELLLVQMTSDVVQLGEAMGVQVREWASPDGVTSVFRGVMLIGTPIVKARYDGKSGIVHATGA